MPVTNPSDDLYAIYAADAMNLMFRKMGARLALLDGAPPQDFIDKLNLDGMDSATPRRISVTVPLPCRAEVYPELETSILRNCERQAIPADKAMLTPVIDALLAPYFESAEAKPWEAVIRKGEVEIVLTGIPSHDPAEAVIAGCMDTIAIQGIHFSGFPRAALFDHFGAAADLAYMLEEASHDTPEVFKEFDMQIDYKQESYLGVNRHCAIHQKTGEEVHFYRLICNQTFFKDAPGRSLEQLEGMLLHETAHVVHGDLDLKNPTPFKALEKRLSHLEKVSNYAESIRSMPTEVVTALLVESHGDPAKVRRYIGSIDHILSKAEIEAGIVAAYLETHPDSAHLDAIEVAADMALEKRMKTFIDAMPQTPGEPVDRNDVARLHEIANPTRYSLPNHHGLHELTEALLTMLDRHQHLPRTLEGPQVFKGCLSQAQEFAADAYAMERMANSDAYEPITETFKTNHLKSLLQQQGLGIDAIPAVIRGEIDDPATRHFVEQVLEHTGQSAKSTHPGDDERIDFASDYRDAIREIRQSSFAQRALDSKKPTPPTR